MKIREIVTSIFDSYYYNRSIYHMIELCTEIKERIYGNCKAECTDDGDAIYGTSPRSGWVFAEYKKEIISCINDMIVEYNKEV